MADDNIAPAAEQQGEEQQAAIEGGAYELIRARLLEQGTELGKRATTLNENRLKIFGGIEMNVLGNERIRTDNNCIPRDIVPVQGKLLFGFNVYLGLKKEINVGDVFSVHTMVASEEAGLTFEQVPLEEVDFLNADNFVRDFSELYKYYKDTTLTQLRIIGGKLLAVFRIGEGEKDIKVMRWGLSTDGAVTYIDNRGDEDHVFPPSHDFEWTETGRDDFIYGKYPHVNILDEVFVETVGGDLTVKVEDNTEDGQGIYREVVEDKDQTLDDGKIEYAKLGTLILLRVLPYREEVYRYLVFNTRSYDVRRIDAIGRSCIQLPEDHGVIFPGGYYLQDGETKTFDLDTEGLEFSRVIRSPNGEDVMYVFYQKDAGRSVLLSYNLIRKEVASPITCNGYSNFDDGKMVVFRAEDEPTRVHMMNVWQTAYMSEDHATKLSAASEHAGSMVVKVGNAELVRGISDCNSLRRMIHNQKPTMQIYEDLIAATQRIVDAYYWLAEEELGQPKEVLAEILKNAELIIDEFEKVLAIQKASAEALQKASEDQDKLIDDIRPDLWQTVDHFVNAMARLRSQRGHLITLREMRYMDLEKVTELETQVAEYFENLSEKAVEFLLGDEALKPYHDKYAEMMANIEAMEQARDSLPITETIDETATGLDLLTEVVGGLKIDDANARTSILEEISEIFSLVNRARATLEIRRKELLSKEGVAEFGAQFKLFGQSVQSALAVCDSPEKCDEQLSRLMVQLEELEGRFTEFDQYLGQLAEKREEVYEAINGRKQTLLEERQRRCQNLAGAGDRILQGVHRRALTFKDLDQLNSYFAADAMVLKIRDISDQLMKLGDTVRADEVVARLKSTRDTSARQIRDKAELFAEGDNIIKLGKHHFTVNTQTLDLTMLPYQGGMGLHLSGTDFFQLIDDQGLNDARDFWEQTLVSETTEVSRSEYLAACMLFDADAGRNGLSLEGLKLAMAEENGLLKQVRQYAANRYDEGYDRGVHDVDATAILEKLIGLYQSAGLLRHAPKPRSLACLFWGFVTDKERKEYIQRKAQNLGRLRDVFAVSPAHEVFAEEVAREIGHFAQANNIPHHPEDLRIAGAYLSGELAAEQLRFATSAEATTLRDAFMQDLEDRGTRAAFEEDQRALENELETRYELTMAWLVAFVASSSKEAIKQLQPVLEETAALIITEGRIDRDVSGAMSSVELGGLLGQHPTIDNGKLSLRLDEFLSRLSHFAHERVPGYRAFRELRHKILEQAKVDLRIDEFTPRVLTSFVRNKLINDVYLHLIGDNLSKQIGAAGDKKRTDLMGLLLLISPPGYGKTTLMEYMANRLGLIFMKVNGPSLGHSVISFDPTEAPNATARQEVNKINLAFEMGNNVMLYLDDIQHTNPELLQKFISLCDASRRVEGVWNGRTRTYDLRGKKFCVVMAGNPYTEAGEKFQIPDMLANRADIYNLGDILGGKEDVFALSYIENALTSNAVMQPLATRELEDLYLLVRMAQGEEIPASELKHTYSAVEIEEIIGVLQKLFRCQDVVLKVNAAYIASAATDEQFRTEPRFQLQGSYRNMNKMAEKIVAIMNEQELEQMIDDHYQGEAQTLTSGAEANLLKLGEIRGTHDEEQAERWEEIKKTFGRNQIMGSDEDDPVARVTATLGGIGQHIESLHESITEAAQMGAEAANERHRSLAEPFLEELDGLKKTIAQAVQYQAQQSSSQGSEQVKKIEEGLYNLRDAITKGAQYQAQQHTAQSGQQAKQLMQTLSGLGESITKGAQYQAQQSTAQSGQQAKQLMQTLSGLGESITNAARYQAKQATTQGGEQAKQIGTELVNLRDTISKAVQYQVQQSQARGGSHAKQVAEELSHLRRTLGKASQMLTEDAKTTGGEQLSQLLTELNNLRQTVVWSTQTSAQSAKARETQQLRQVMSEFDKLRETIAEAAHNSARLKAHQNMTQGASNQALAKYIGQLSQNLATAAPPQAPAPVQYDGAKTQPSMPAITQSAVEAAASQNNLVGVLEQQTALVEGTLVPLVKGVIKSLHADRGTLQKLDQALEMLKAIEEKAKKGGFRAYDPVGTSVKKK